MSESSGASSGAAAGGVDCSFVAVSDYTQALNVGAIFVILTASVLGTSIPLVSKRYPALQRYPFIFIWGKHVGTGVLLALALIHLLAPAFAELGNPCLPAAWSVDYQYAPLFALLAALAMHFIETIAHQYMDGGGLHSHGGHSDGHSRPHQGHDHRSATPTGSKFLSPSSSSSDMAADRASEHGTMTTVAEVELMENGDVHKPSSSSASNHVDDALNSADHDSDDVSSSPTKERGDKVIEVQRTAAVSDAHFDGGGHTHSLLLGDVDKTVAAYILEFGLTSHSVIIGITVGVASRSDLNTLLPALCFHQFFEGMALGARLADVGFSALNEVTLMLVYSLSCPIGIAIGVGIASSYNQNGNTANLVEGSFDSISAGIILYVGFVQMLGIEFDRDYKTAVRSGDWRKPIALWCALYFGAGVMAFIGRSSSTRWCASPACSLFADSPLCASC